jgi:hypothetical protein
MRGRSGMVPTVARHNFAPWMGRERNEKGPALKILATALHTHVVGCMLSLAPESKWKSRGTDDMIQAIHKGVEIEMEVHQFEHGWKCDYALIKHPERTETIHLGDQEFPTMDLAVESALQKAREAIDRAQLSDSAKSK